MLIHSPLSVSVCAGAEPPSPAVIFPFWKGEGFVTSPKGSSASPVLLFSLFNSYMCTCRKVSSLLVSRTLEWFIFMPQHCSSLAIPFNCTGGLWQGEEAAGRAGAAASLTAFQLYKRISCLRLGSKIDVGLL